MFAMQNVPPQVGRVEAFHVSWPAGTKDKIKTPVQMVDCKELREGGLYAGQSNNQAMQVDNAFNGRIEGNFLCPIGLETLNL